MRNQAPNCENQQYLDIYQCLKTQNEQFAQYKQKRWKNKPLSAHSAERNHDSYVMKSDSIQATNSSSRRILQEIQNFSNQSQKTEKHLATSHNISQIIKPSLTLVYQPQFISKLPCQYNQKQTQQQQQCLYQSQYQQFPQNIKATFQAVQKKQSGSKFKTEICKNWISYGKCNYGQKCQFAHGKQDLNQKTTQKVTRHYKSKLCEKFHTTSVCNYGPCCLFIHENRSVKEIKVFGYFQRRLNDFSQEYLQLMSDKSNTKMNCLTNHIPSRRLPFFYALTDNSSLVLC